MNLKKEDLPATLQAFELQDDREIFIAEQVVSTQAEAEIFTTRYIGKLIKAKKVPVIETGNYGTSAYRKRTSQAGLIMVVIILVIVALVIYGFSTGWIQDKLNLKI